MNQIDLLILIFIGFFLMKGLFRGFFHEVFGLVGLMVALIFATKYSSEVAAMVNKILRISSNMAAILGFILIFFGIVLFFQVVIHFFQKIFQYTMLGWLEKLAGGTVGFVKGATVASLMLIFLSSLPFSGKLFSEKEHSIFYQPMVGFAPKVFNFVMEAVPGSKSFYSELKESVDAVSSKKRIKNKKLLKTLRRREELHKQLSKENERSR